MISVSLSAVSHSDVVWAAIIFENIGRQKKGGAVGISLQSTDVTIVDLEESKREMPLGEERELIARGPQIMRIYYNNPEETARAFRRFKGGAWIFTGDVARTDEEGYLTIVNRVKDMIIGWI